MSIVKQPATKKKFLNKLLGNKLLGNEPFGPHSTTVLSCCAISTVLGTIHAFSVFIPEWELLLQVNRGQINLVYSIALVSLTLAVLWGYKLFAILSPLVILLIVSIGTGAGLWIAAESVSLTTLYLSYGCLFGAANGLGYGYVLQLAGQTAAKRHTLAMGLTTASYALGATVAPPLLLALINYSGNGLALKISAVVILVVIAIFAQLINRDRAVFSSNAEKHTIRLNDQQRRCRYTSWLAYGLAVFAGLMIIGHAYTLASWYGYTGVQLALVPVVLSLGNLLGGCLSGYIAMRISIRILIAWLPLLGAVAVAALYAAALFLQTDTNTNLNAISNLYWLSATAFVMIGFAYGATIALYPVLIFDLYGKLLSARIYGQVFTAWGFAGLIAPTAAGILYDRFTSYLPALAIAIVLSLMSTIVIRRLPTQAELLQ